MSARSENLPLRMQTLEAEREALELRLRGWSYPQIADEQGIHPQTAKQRVDRAIRDVIPRELRDDARSLQHERITAMIRFNLTVIWDPATPTEDKFKAQALLHRWFEREARLLGLDMPVVLELHNTGDDLDAEIQALMAQLTRPVAPAPAGHRPPPPMPSTNGHHNGSGNGAAPNGAAPPG
jgi:hypothetical protein